MSALAASATLALAPHATAEPATVKNCSVALLDGSRALRLINPVTNRRTAFQLEYRGQVFFRRTVHMPDAEFRAQWTRKPSSIKELFAPVGPCVELYDEMKRQGGISDQEEAAGIERARAELEKPLPTFPH